MVLFVKGPVFRGELNKYLAPSGTHCIRVNQISSASGKYRLNYWDYGSWKSKKISHSKFFLCIFWNDFHTKVDFEEHENILYTIICALFLWLQFRERDDQVLYGQQE